MVGIPKEKMIDVPSRKAVTKAGKILVQRHIKNTISLSEWLDAYDTFSKWRALHTYPIQTFLSNARRKVRSLGLEKRATIARRLKRAPSILAKLQRFPTMELGRMQDIGGLRIILPTMSDLEKLHRDYVQSATRKTKHFQHSIGTAKDYIKNPKDDGYRSLHQVFKYCNKRHPELNGLSIELQIRTQLQHSWATAVETLGLLLNSSFKTGRGEEKYKQFFRLCSVAFAYKEKTAIHPDFQKYSEQDIHQQLKSITQETQVLSRLKGMNIASRHIEHPKNKNAEYYLIKLDLDKHMLAITPYTKNQIIEAETAYSALEKEVEKGNNWEVVLVSLSDVKDIKKAYPNYFLDTTRFVREIEKITNAI
ncbi:RelA/SpoT domain-containing protein [Pasteurella multocida]|uniref:RelA/SpoT domain-containing protein n=1 Tax=Pasteurella multocida TaxID=747 RepID=UPI0020231D3C|nr:RelA/SpoT domain-containing protein [Pasteurella multocida]URH94735.1 RelA/SpoT domain-containing protein [Pasteurella multocida]URI01126.1 RelA/SpoT domain-containing protein [Pasteurella multocida]HEA3249401.1 RelA/SpoT domain-containing protein [Pasteurella multocida]